MKTLFSGRMVSRVPRPRWAIAIAGLVLNASGMANAGCSRPLQVPVAPLGLSVTTYGGVVGGVYPEVMRRIASETGCAFQYMIVPRARQEAMFAAGSADLLMPATRTSARDAHGDFVPMMRSRAMVISLMSDRAPIDSLQALAERRELRVALVRGFDYGDAYLQLMQTLRTQKRLVLEADAVAVARAMERGLADVTVMAPSVFTGTLLQDEKTLALVERLRFESVQELTWGDSGVYFSRSLPRQDREQLEEALSRSMRSGAFWRAVQRNYPPGSYEDGLKPITLAK